MDIIGADFFRLFVNYGTFTCQSPALQLPIGSEKQFAGVVDLIRMKAFYYDDELETSAGKEIPEGLIEQARDYRERILETAAEYDDRLMQKYFDGAEITAEECYQALRKATIYHELVPVLCGSSYRNKGVQQLLDAVVHYLPSPPEVGAVKGNNLKTGEEDFRLPAADAPFAALVFKIMTDPYVGKLAFVRVYSGKIASGSALNSTRQERQRIGRLPRMHANYRQEIDEAVAGDILALVGLKGYLPGNPLRSEPGHCSGEDPVPRTGDLGRLLSQKPRLIR